MRSRIMTTALIVVALVAALAVAVSCSSSPKTLEDYFAANQSEWDEAVASIQEGTQGVMDVDLSVKGNTITQIMTYTQTYAPDAVAAMKTYFEGQADSFMANLKSQIATMEEKTGIKGITWEFSFNNGDGTPIYQATATA